jgi:hypothetical protein
MPKRTDIKSIMIIGAGPIVIGQACEFDYSGTQACKALKDEGYRVILVNSNPATIMTDPDLADATYVEPITAEIVAKIIEKERPDALLPTMGGQTALNCALALYNDGTLEKYGVQMIGADADAIDKAENRQRFREAMDKIGLESARSGMAHTVDEAFAKVKPILPPHTATVGGWQLADVGGMPGDDSERKVTLSRTLGGLTMSYEPSAGDRAGLSFKCEGSSYGTGFDFGNPPEDHLKVIAGEVTEAYADLAKDCKPKPPAQAVLMQDFPEALATLEGWLEAKPFVYPPETTADQGK